MLEIMYRYLEKITTPVKVSKIELLQNKEISLVRSTDNNGNSGIGLCTEQIRFFKDTLRELVAPYLIGKDIRQLPSLIEGVYLHASNYKLSGPALWCPVAWVESSLFDLLGKMLNTPVHRFFCDEPKQSIPVYMSSLRRDTDPSGELEWLKPKCDEAGTRAVKLKIGGRMSRNDDASPGRTETLIPLARSVFGDNTELYADANGSYTGDKALLIGHLLEDNRYGFFEEPCPFDDNRETRRLSENLSIAIAGGEQEGSYMRFMEMLEEKVVDILQPDISYNGGLIRTHIIAEKARAIGIPVTIHSPQAGPLAIYMVQFAAGHSGLGPYQEYNAEQKDDVPWCYPSLAVRSGAAPVPEGPGMGLELDPAFINKCTVAFSLK